MEERRKAQREESRDTSEARPRTKSLGIRWCKRRNPPLGGGEKKKNNKDGRLLCLGGGFQHPHKFWCKLINSPG